MFKYVNIVCTASVVTLEAYVGTYLRSQSATLISQLIGPVIGAGHWRLILQMDIKIQTSS